MTACYCGSGKTYTDCCQPIHQDHKQAHTPEQLMRSRYCAHVLGLVDFVINTYHPSCNAESEREAIAESVQSEWQRLEVVSTASGAMTMKAMCISKRIYWTNIKNFAWKSVHVFYVKMVCGTTLMANFRNKVFPAK